MHKGAKFKPLDVVEIDQGHRLATGKTPWFGTVLNQLKSGYVWVSPDAPCVAGGRAKFHSSRLSYVRSKDQ